MGSKNAKHQFNLCKIYSKSHTVFNEKPFERDCTLGYIADVFQKGSQGKLAPINR